MARSTFSAVCDWIGKLHDSDNVLVTVQVCVPGQGSSSELRLLRMKLSQNMQMSRL
jgi:hypothetical protein